MIKGYELIEKLYSDYDEYEVQEEKLYSTGDSELDDLLEKAFCEGYEYAQKEFGRTGKTAIQAKQFFTKTGNREQRKAGELFDGIVNSGGIWSESKAKNRREAGEQIKKAVKVARESKSSDGSGSLLENKYLLGDRIITTRGNLFDELNNRQKMEFNKRLYKGADSGKRPGSFKFDKYN